MFEPRLQAGQHRQEERAVDRSFISLSLYDSTRPDKPWSMRLLAKPLSFENLVNVLGTEECQ